MTWSLVALWPLIIEGVRRALCVRRPNSLSKRSDPLPAPVTPPET